jgi:hypothetical protein
MVTHQELREHIGRKPFEPFRVTLTDGRHVDVTQLNQAATLDRRMVVGMGDDHFEWIWLKEIERVERLPAHSA